MLMTLYSGWAFRYLRADRGRRQIADILLPGDLIGLESALAGEVRHWVRSITPVSVCILDAAKFPAMFELFPDLSRALVTTLMDEEHRADRRALMLGRQRPTQRLGYMMLDLFARLKRRGQCPAASFRMPLTYEQLADLIGASRSQIGLSLAELKDRAWAVLGEGRLSILDEAAMAEGCGYSPPPAPSRRALI